MKKAFTLAETLITLAVIGVIAAITIPTLVNNYQKKIWATQFRDNISIFAQGMKALIISEGCAGSDLICTGLFPTGNVDDNYYQKLDKAMNKVFKGVKSCTNADTSCDYAIKALKYTLPTDQSAKGLKVSRYSTLNSSGTYMYVLSNGTIFYLANMACKKTTYPNVSENFQYRCADIVFDINGSKKPNTFGRDIFAIIVSSNGDIYPYGGHAFAKFLQGENWETSKNYWRSQSVNSKNNCSTSEESFGYACSARIMENNWVMDY